MTDIEYLKKYLDNDKLELGIKRLKQGEPVQYIIGTTNFYGYEFKVNKNVLIPRFETELLVEKTIKYIEKYFDKSIKIIDLGTGSGCIAITFKKQIPKSTVYAVDISSSALKIACENSKKNNVKIKFIKNDFLENIDNKFDVIISNPPYIGYEEDIMDIVKNNEPSIALFAPNNGLFCYEKILKESTKNVNKKSIIAFEIGYKQGKSLISLAKKHYPTSKIIIEKDYNLKERFLFIFNNCE